MRQPGADRDIPLRDLGQIFSPTWSPDDQAIAFSALTGGFTDLFVYALATNRLKQLTDDAFADLHPAWSPDGRTIAFFSMRAGGRDLWLMQSDGTRKRRLTRDGSLNEYPPWSPDGRTLAFQSAREGEF